MLSGTLDIRIPGVSAALDKLDALKAKFMQIPANTRSALDRLARVRMMAEKNGPITEEFSRVSQTLEQNLKRTQSQWNLAAERFSELDSLRRSGGLKLTTDVVVMASQLISSATSVIKNADTNIRAVDRLAEQYLTAEQRSQLSLASTGTAGFAVGIPLLAVGVAALYFLRRR